MDVCEAKNVHETTTQESKLRYCFTPKHHGGGRSDDSKWHPALSRPEEFQVFDMADVHQLKDKKGDLFGLWIVETKDGRKLLELGTKHEQVARFWAEQGDGHPWHGHPVWHVMPEKKPGRSGESGNRSKQECRPDDEVFRRMVERRLLSANNARRLRNGSHIGKLGGSGQ